MVWRPRLVSVHASSEKIMFLGYQKLHSPKSNSSPLKTQGVGRRSFPFEAYQGRPIAFLKCISWDDPTPLVEMVPASGWHICSEKYPSWRLLKSACWIRGEFQHRSCEFKTPSFVGFFFQTSPWRKLFLQQLSQWPYDLGLPRYCNIWNPTWINILGGYYVSKVQ